MSIWNKVLIGLIIPASLCFIFFAMRALKTHQYWRDIAQKLEKKTETLVEQNAILMDGKPGTKDPHCIREAKLQLHKLLMNRGRIWRNVTPGGYNAETGALIVTTDLPNPNGIEVGTVLYLFSQAGVPQGGRYLGAFNVVAKADKQLQMQPSVMMTRPEVERLQKSPGPWVMYDVIPSDEHAVLAKMDDAARRADLPASSVEEYLKDGKAQPDGSKYVRPLRDYRVLLTDYYHQRAVMFELLDAARKDNHYLQNALADARKQEQFHNTEINTLRGLLAEEQRKLVAVKTHLKAVEDKFGEVRSGIQELTQANRTMVGRIAWIQAEATRLIDQRTQHMAQSK